MINVVGGIYRERCMWPHWDEVFGSAGRAASALARLGRQVRLHGFADPISREVMEIRAAAESFQFVPNAVEAGVQFHYIHGLAHPRIKQPPAPQGQITVAADKIIRYGMIEGTAVVNGDYVVYDPQNVGRPERFSQNGSTATHLALVLNRFEASQMTGCRDLSSLELAERLCDLEGAEVVVIKLGTNGALVYTKSAQATIPAYESNRVWKIGTGDIFVASFAHAWMGGATPVEAAHFASRATAFYCEQADFATLSAMATFSPTPIIPSRRRTDGWQPTIYLAGPFFALNQLWVVEEARNALRDMGAQVISPYHDIGKGPAEIVVPQDIDAIRKSDLIFAISDGFDPGTIFEVGFAKALGKPVVVYAENEAREDLKMMAGTDCFICSDFVTAIYRAIWTASVL